MSSEYLLKRPYWWQLIKRRNWERLFGKAKAVYVDEAAGKREHRRRAKKRSLKGVVGG